LEPPNLVARIPRLHILVKPAFNTTFSDPRPSVASNHEYSSSAHEANACLRKSAFNTTFIDAKAINDHLTSPASDRLRSIPVSTFELHDICHL
jgi:hypothetical protein